MICFIHNERAGGTTLHHIFQNNYLGYITLTPWHYQPEDDQKFFTDKEFKYLTTLLPFIKGFGGHTTRCFLGYEQQTTRKIQYITFLRDPVERYLSHYNYQKRVMNRKRTLDEFLGIEWYDNFMTKRIAGSPDIHKAIQYLNDKFSFVGLTEFFDESLLLMKRELHLTNFCIRYEKKNRSPKPNYLNDKDLRDPRTLQQVVQRNALDIQLYEYAKANIFPKYKEKFNGDLSSELTSFVNANETYKFGRMKRHIGAGYKRFLYKHIEYLLWKAIHSN